MKSLLKALLIVTYPILVLGCMEENLPQENIAKVKKQTNETKGLIVQDAQYYWYRDEKIPLYVYPGCVNILLSDPYYNETELNALCEDMHLTIENKYQGKGLIKATLNEECTSAEEYRIITGYLKNDPRIIGVFPFFYCGEKTEPVGTSQLFYLRLKGDGLYDPEPMEQLAKEYKIKIVKEIPYMPDWYILSIEGSSLENSIDATNRFYESGLFRDVDPAFMLHFQPCATNDPLFSQQWGLKNSTYTGYDINVEGAWTFSTGLGANIAIVDQGIDSSHTDISSNYDATYNTQSGTVIPSIHGTHVAGIAAAAGNNYHYITGVAYNAKIMGISNDLSVQQDSISFHLASGISYAWQNGADVINISWGHPAGPGNVFNSAVLENAIKDAMVYGRGGLGSVVVCCSGNYGNNGPEIVYPALLDDRILIVGSITDTGYRAWDSGYGSQLDIVAPGEEIISTVPGNLVDYLSGTSMAAPHASGVAALMISENQNLTRESIVRFIELSAKKISPGGAYTYSSTYNRYNGGWNQEVGYGLIDATAAVTIAHHAGIVPLATDPLLDAFVASGGPILTDYYPISGSSDLTFVYSLQSAQINSAYTYFWHFTTSGNTGWFPSFSYVGNDTGAVVELPCPTANTVLNMYCDIYNGSTHVCTAHRTTIFY